MKLTEEQQAILDGEKGGDAGESHEDTCHVRRSIWRGDDGSGDL